MFTGIIQKKERIVAIEKRGKSRIVRIKKPAVWKLKEGASVMVNGICSTVRAKRTRYFDVEYMPETLSKTTVNSWQTGENVNLERSLTHGAPVDGHFVQGHVDARGRVVRVLERGSSRELSIKIPPDIAPYVAPKGSIAVNGVSLTIASLEKNVCIVALVPYTLEHTNLADLKKADEVNIETDMIARYLARLTKR